MNWDKFHETEALEAAGDYDRAIRELQEMTDTAADSVDRYLILAGIASNLRQLQRFEEAREHIHRSYEVLGPDNPYYASAMFIEAQIDEELGRYDQALARLDDIAQRYPKVLADPGREYLNHDISCFRGILLTWLGRYQEAHPLLEQAAANGSCKEQALYCLGVCCYHLGLLRSAERYLKEALTFGLNRGYALWTHYYLAMSYFWQRKYAWARQEFEWCLQHIETGNVRRDYVLEGLIKTSEALGQTADVERYSKMQKIIGI